MTAKAIDYRLEVKVDKGIGSDGKHNIELEYHSSHPSYKKAVSEGLRLAGAGNFFVNTGDYLPSRREMLLEPLRACDILETL